MAGQGEKYKRHFVLGQTGRCEPYAYPPRAMGEEPGTPHRDRRQHGDMLQQQFDALQPTIEQARSEQEDAGLGEGFGVRITFESFPDVQLVLKSLDRAGSGIELLNVRKSGGKTFATVFVPDGKLVILEHLVQSYLDETKGQPDRPSHAALLNAIANIRAAALEDLWTDDPALFPVNDDEALWWEVWLPVRKDRDAVVDQFKRLANEQDLRLCEGELPFPERTVVLVYGTADQMKQSMHILNQIAGLRRTRETAEFFDSLPVEEQPEWTDDLLSRLSVPESGEDVPHVCILDTGVNHGHPLLKPILARSDVYSINEQAWGLDDQAEHGTAQAGLAGYGNLTEVLPSNFPIEVPYRLESVKLLDCNGGNKGDSKHHGYVTMEAVAYPELDAPGRQRVYSMAITAESHEDNGRPTAWSATLDGLAAGAQPAAGVSRLFVVSAGDVLDQNAWLQYPDSNTCSAIHDPGQSWNALTVGAMTRLVHITEPGTQGFEPIAPYGSLSPTSTTSAMWDSDWPLKPDIVFEGGNAARDEHMAFSLPSLRLLSTHAKPTERLFDTTNATSAAAALASRMAAQLMAEYPSLRPETIRGLLVHSAEWTDAMYKALNVPTQNAKKSDMVHLVRHCGFGEPRLERARWSLNNSLTLVCEGEMQPFQRKPGSTVPVYNEMSLHKLPWPLEALKQLGETEVEMRVTLSYFIEPNPSQRGVKTRYRYESHGLRFTVRRPTESVDQLRERVNKKARDEGYEKVEGKDNGWLIGTDARHHGSIHSDTWRGTAVDLASQDAIVVYPVTGWWKTRYGLNCYSRIARYSLLVSIHAPEVDVDLYTPIANQVQTPIEIEV